MKPVPDKANITQPDKQAEDIAYTINHALVCTVTDFIDPVVGKWTQDWWGKKVSIGCGHDHSHDAGHGHNCGHNHHHHNKASLWNLSVAEVTGDFAAVPLTVGMQRYFPVVMQGIEKMAEPIVGGLFRYGVKRGNVKWAHQHGVAPDSEEAAAHAKALYRYEMHHLPQAVVWTASSIAINLGMQKALGSTMPLPAMLAGKANGALISTGLVVGARSLMPHAAKRWDEKTRDELFLPATKTVSRWFGVEEKAVDRMAARHHELHETSWQDKLDSDGSPSPSR